MRTEAQVSALKSEDGENNLIENTTTTKKVVTFKSFVIGKLYIFVILQKNLAGEQIWRIILYIFYVFGTQRHRGKAKHFISDESGAAIDG